MQSLASQDTFKEALGETEELLNELRTASVVSSK